MMTVLLMESPHYLRCLPTEEDLGVDRTITTDQSLESNKQMTIK